MPQDQAKDLALLTAAAAGQSGDEPPKRADQFLAKRRSRVAYGILAPGGIYLMLAFIVPLLSAVVRRLHDTGRSGWWYFIGLVPFIGGIWLFVLTVMPSELAPNQYGPDPLGGVSERMWRLKFARFFPAVAVEIGGGGFDKRHALAKHGPELI